ncbi:MAG: carboxypeptidase-like regulatory domain-containing protein [Candidatus Pacebacteria bacterium]|nr:carboxypeptidase-like regulatory domain-containing protein [Candidatus Paceibacterota bacterium]
MLQSQYTYSQSYSTDSAGSVTIADLEWDVYDVTLDTSAYDIARACAQVPYSLLPDDTATLTLTVVSAVANSLRVRVEDTSGDPILGASVDIQRSGLSDTDTTGVCGQVFFNTGLIIAGDYELEVSASGYTTESVSDFSVDGTTVTTVVLSTT